MNAIHRPVPGFVLNPRFLINQLVVSCLLLAAAGCRTAADSAGKPPEPEVLSTVASSSTTGDVTNKPVARPGKVQASANVLPAHFQATIYEVQASSNRLNSLDGKSLARQATTSESLLKALSSFGPARVLYRFDQPVNVFSESLTLGSREPVVMGSRVSQRGEALNTVTYQEVGAIIRLSARIPPKETRRKGPDVSLSVELAVLSSSDVEMIPGRKATFTRNLSLDHTEELTLGQPRVMLAVSSTSRDEKQPPALYVIRYVFNH